MIQLLLMVVLVEGVVALLLMVKIGPLRELVMKGLDQLKMGKGPATLKTLACTMAVIMVSSVTSMAKIQNRGLKVGTVTPMDQVLWKTHLLEALLMGYMLFLGFVIDRLHHCLRKLILLRETVGASKWEVERLHKEHQHIKEKEKKASEEVRSLQEQVSSLAEKLEKLNLESDEREARAVSAEAHVASLQKQAEYLLLEYDQLLEDNQILHSQALAVQG